MKKALKIALFSVLGLLVVTDVLVWMEFVFLGTAWTMVMDLKHPSVTYYSRRHFDKPFRFELSQSN